MFCEFFNFFTTRPLPSRYNTMVDTGFVIYLDTEMQPCDPDPYNNSLDTLIKSRAIY